jgi:hypothetical protein
MRSWTLKAVVLGLLAIASAGAGVLIWLNNESPSVLAQGAPDSEKPPKPKEDRGLMNPAQGF